MSDAVLSERSMRVKVTGKMRAFAASTLGAAADATDEVVVSAVTKALGEGKLTFAQAAELETEFDPTGKVKGLLASEIAELEKRQDAKFEQLLKALNPTTEPPAQKGLGDKPAALDANGNPASVEDVLGLGNKGGNVRVKKASEQYSSTKTAATWQKDMHSDERRVGAPAYFWSNTEGGTYDQAVKQQVDVPSEAEYAKMGMLIMKRLADIGFARHPMLDTEHGQLLLKEMAHEDKWFVPETGGNNPSRLKDFQVKAVLDSATSGGEEAVPEYFDYAAIMTPLLHGELFPYVQIVRPSRGSSAQSYKVGTPTFVSTASGSAVSEFNTSGFVSAFDTEFFPATCAISYGNDFLEDAAPEFGRNVMNQIGEKSKAWYDEQIAIGDGTTEPQGIFVASGTSVGAESGHTHSSFTYNDVTNVAFGIDKAHRNAFGGDGTRFVMNDTQYREFMQIVTGVTGDARPIFGMGLKDYMLGPYGVSIQNNISNGNFALCNLRGYRLYIRQGLQFITETRGSTLTLENRTLLVARKRVGGQITRTQYIAELG